MIPLRNHILAVLTTRWTSLEEISDMTGRHRVGLLTELCKMRSEGMVWSYAFVGQAEKWWRYYALPHDVGDPLIGRREVTRCPHCQAMEASHEPA